MKLRNKKTGEILQLSVKCENGGELKTLDLTTNTDRPITLTELNAGWEDYEEPSKTIWQIKDSGELQDFKEDDFSDGYMESSKSIGNYFETREEAEKAVEKLKAWKRLKDKGFRFDNFIRDAIYFNLDEEQIQSKSILKDLDLLFGGEE